MCSIFPCDAQRPFQRTRQGHFKGRADQVATITAFEKLPADDRRLVATEVAGFQPHSTVADVIDNIQDVHEHRRR